MRENDNNYDIQPDWYLVLQRWHVRVLLKPIDEFSGLFSKATANVKNVCLNWELRFLFDFLTFIMRQDECTRNTRAGIQAAFKEARMAYFVQDNTIFPSASKEEGDTLARVFADVQSTEYAGARSHLREAGRLLSSGDAPGSVRESIHAVESVAKVVEPSVKTLSDALNKLSKNARLNVNLKRGFNALYDWTSDERGIRHAKVFEAEANVSQHDAAFMLGACASFISFMIAELGAAKL